MRKAITMIMTLLIFLTSCSTTSNNNDGYVDAATSRALSRLNNVLGYNLDNTYTLKNYLRSKNDMSSQLFVLYVNNNSIMFFTLEEVEQDNGGDTIVEVNGKKYIYQLLDESTLANYPVENTSTTITSDRFILESIDSINMNTDHQLTEATNYQAIQDLISVYLSYDEPVTVTVYEHLNVINVDYDKQTNSIICSNSDTLEYPIKINGQAIELIQISLDHSSTSGSIPLDEDILIVKALNDKVPYVIVCSSNTSINGVVIRSDETIEITAPVILKKAYLQSLEGAKKMSAYQELFTFTYSNN